MTSWIKGGKGINRSFVQAIYQTLKIMAPNVSFRPIPIHNTLLHYNVNHNKIIWYYLCQKLTNQSCFDLNLIEFKHFLSFEVFVGFLKPKVWFLSLFQNHYYMIFGNLIKEKIMTSSLRFKPFISIADFRLLRQKKILHGLLKYILHQLHTHRWAFDLSSLETASTCLANDFLILNNF